jgi:hypothetical protein
MYKYVTRERQWLRKEVYQVRKEMERKIGSPCSVMHVRRADVIMHNAHSRKYYAISDYMRLLPEDKRQNVFLLTDDADAIDEALEFYPDVNWTYFNRTRFRGASGGWENQIPSNNPKHEVITLVTTLQLVQMCDCFVYGESAFADIIERTMREKRAPKSYYESFRVDVGLPDLVSINNTDSDKKLQKLLDERRSQKLTNTTN